jgi:hypothetical protein
MLPRVLTASILAALLAFSLVGCKQLEQRFTPPPKVVTQEATVAVGGAPVQGELAAETPEGLPLWPGAKVVESTGTEDAYGLTLVTSDPYEDVLNGVAAGFEKAGWQVAQDSGGGEDAASVVLTIKSDAFEGFVTISQIETATTQLDYVVTATQ